MKQQHADAPSRLHVNVPDKNAGWQTTHYENEIRWVATVLSSYIRKLQWNVLFEIYAYWVAVTRTEPDSLNFVLIINSCRSKEEQSKNGTNTGLGHAPRRLLYWAHRWTVSGSLSTHRMSEFLQSKFRSSHMAMDIYGIKRKCVLCVGNQLWAIE